MKIKIKMSSRQWKLVTFGVLLFSIGTVIAQVPEGTQFFRIVNQTTGNNVTTIDREGNINTTGSIQTNGSIWVLQNIYAPNDAIAEALIDIDTSCTAIQKLTTSGNDLTCSNDLVNTSAEVQAAQTVNTSAEVISVINDTYQYFELMANETLYVDCNVIYGGSDGDFCADAEGAGGVDDYVNETGDTMTGDLVMNGGDINLTANTDRIRDHTTGLGMYFDSGWVIEVN